MTSSEDRPWNIVLPVTGFIAISVQAPNGGSASSEAAREANRLLAGINWAIDLGHCAGRPAVLRVDPIAEYNCVAVLGKEQLEPQAASKARVRTRRSRVTKTNE